MLSISKKPVIFDEPVWFHFMKSLKSGGVIRENDSVDETDLLFLTTKEEQLFNEQILPLLENSPYRKVRVKK